MRALRLELAAGTILAFALVPPTAFAYTAEDDMPVSIAAPADDSAFPPSPAAEFAQAPAAVVAAPARPAEVDGVPVPEPADVPPVTAAILDGPAPAAPAASAAPPDAAIANAVPMPEPANVPPPTVKDIGKVPLSIADAAVADRLKDMIAKAERLIPAKKERAAVEAFYQARAFAPLWIENGEAGPRAKAAVARIKAAEQDGLEPSDYAVPDLKALAAAPETLADAELKLTAAVLGYARHAQAGRV